MSRTRSSVNTIHMHRSSPSAFDRIGNLMNWHRGSFRVVRRSETIRGNQKLSSSVHGVCRPAAKGPPKTWAPTPPPRFVSVTLCSRSMNRSTINIMLQCVLVVHIVRAPESEMSYYIPDSCRRQDKRNREKESGGFQYVLFRV